MAYYARFIFRCSGGRRITVTGRDVLHAKQRAREELMGIYAREGLEFPSGATLTLIDQQRGKRRKRPNWGNYKRAQGRPIPAWPR